MISEERFEELVKKRTKVYWVYKSFVEIAVACFEDAHWFGCDNVFETEEEAKEYLKYGNVTRTEKFPYVSWEEFQKQGNIIRFKEKNYDLLCD